MKAPAEPQLRRRLVAFALLIRASSIAARGGAPRVPAILGRASSQIANKNKKSRTRFCSLRTDRPIASKAECGRKQKDQRHDQKQPQCSKKLGLQERGPEQKPHAQYDRQDAKSQSHNFPHCVDPLRNFRPPPSQWQYPQRALCPFCTGKAVNISGGSDRLFSLTGCRVF
jgi:hypothetical protein